MAVTKIEGATQIKTASIPASNTDGSLIKTDGSVAFSGDQAMGNHKLTGLAAPSANDDAARLIDVNNAKQGLDVKDSVRVVTTTALPAYTRVANVITENTPAAGLPAIDGVTLVVSDRLLLKDGASGSDNGIYTVTVVGNGAVAFVLTRAIDADVSAEVTSGMFMWVTEGTVNTDTGWILATPDPITLNTDALSFTQFSGIGAMVAGAGLTKTGNTVDAVAGDASILVNANEFHIQYSGTPTTQAPGDTATAGTDVHAAHVDHKHGWPTQACESFAGDTGTSGGYVFTVVGGTPLANTYTEVFLNGLLQEPGGGNDYTISGAAVTFLFIPVAADRVRIVYWHA